MIVYVDVLLISNFIIGYFLLLTSALISGYTYSRKRIIIAALVGACSCLLIFVQFPYFFLNFIVKILSLFVCVWIAFGIKNKKQFLIQSLCYVFLNMGITGLAFMFSSRSSMIYQNNLFFYLKISPITLVVSSCVVYFFITLFSLIKERINPKQTYNLDVFLKGVKIGPLNSFYDTGFHVKDVLNNKDVVLVSFAKTKNQLTAQTIADIESFFANQYQSDSNIITPVFFNTISGNGIIPGIKADCIIIESRKIENVIIAFTQNPLSENVDAIFGSDIKRQL